MAWLERTGDGALILTLHVQPGARRTEFAGLHGDALKLRLMAPPVDGKANAALIEFVADYCRLPKSRLTLISGHSSRSKRLRIEGAPEDLSDRLASIP